jgi:PAS domain S-box-containing protein
MIIDFVQSIFSTTGFPARWTCGSGWAAEPWWGWIHIFSDLAIWAAYFSLGLLIVLFVQKKRDVPFPVVFFLFGAFIFLCGLTHLIDSVVFYWPVYRLAGLFKLATAIVSVATVGVCLRLTPFALELRGHNESARLINERTAELQDLNRRLREEIDERSRVVLQLGRNQETLKLAMAIGQTGFFDWDLATDVVKLDESEVRLTGLGKLNGIIELDEFFRCIHEDHREPLERVINECIMSGREYHSRFPFTRPDGRKLWLAGRGCAIRNDEGKAISFIGLNYDITEQVERELLLDREAVIARNASQQKSRFIAQVSHEIRTPLAAMLGCVDSLAVSLQPGDTRDTIRILRSQGELLKVLINDVLDISKMEAGRLEFQSRPVAIENVFADVLSLMNPLAEVKGLVIKWQVESKLPKSIVCDRHRLKQVCVNLIGNAIKFTEAGTITIVAKVDDLDPTRSDLVVEIRDTGQGIPNEKLNLIFEEFERVADDVDGVGLGLAISKRLLNLMGGSIMVQSEVGVGSAFVIRIPLGDIRDYEMVAINDITLNAAEMDPTDDLIQKLPLKVLAAEDTRAIQFVLKRMVGSFVDELVIVSNGMQVVEVAMDAEKSVKPFDLILMDIQMPELNGAEATRALRSAGYSKPIIALTAGAMESEKEACMNAGCTYFLSKPIDMHELRRLLAAFCLP